MAGQGTCLVGLFNDLVQSFIPLTMENRSHPLTPIDASLEFDHCPDASALERSHQWPRPNLATVPDSYRRHLPWRRVAVQLDATTRRSRGLGEHSSVP